MKARAQALFAVLTGGVSNLCGYLATGWWFHRMTADGVTHWPVYWIGLCATTVAVTLYFTLSYHGAGTGFFRKPAVR